MSMTAATYDFSDPAVQADPYPIYEELRREVPVFRNGPYRLLSRYNDILLFSIIRAAVVRAAAQTAVLTIMQ